MFMNDIEEAMLLLDSDTPVTDNDEFISLFDIVESGYPRPEWEELIMTNAYCAYMYARHCLRKPWPKAESIIATQPWLATKYAQFLIMGKWQPAEDITLFFGRSDDQDEVTTAQYTAVYYCRYAREGPWPEAERFICKNPKTAYDYAANVLHRRWIKGEKAILGDHESTYQYVKEVLKQRWPQAEKLMLLSPKWSFWYARDIIKDRWPEAEPIITKSKYQTEYLNWVNNLPQSSKSRASTSKF
jgi:hypothetical protein